MIIKDIIESIFSIALFINAILFVPQAIRIFKEKSTKGVSFSTFFGFLLIQLTVVLHGLLIRDYLLVFGYIVSMITCGSVVVLILMYKKNKTANIELEDILDQLPGHIYWKDADGVMLGANKQNWQDFGVSSLEEFKGKTDYDLFSKEDADQLVLVDQEVMRTGKPTVAEEWLTSQGQHTLYLSHKAPLRDKDQNIIGILGVSVDITSSKKETVEKLELLENVIAATPGNVYWLDTDGVYLGCNDNEAEAVGLSSRKDIVGKRNVDIPGFVIPEALDPINQEVMQTGRTVTVEEPAVLKDGTEAVFLSNKVPLRNQEGSIVGMVGISIDITERKKQEEESQRAREAAESANRAKTEFLANMRHDFRTPFVGILGMAQLLESDESDPVKREELACITQSAQALLDQLNEILEFIQLEDGILPIFDKQFALVRMVNDLVEMMRPSARSQGLRLNVHCDDALPMQVVGDRQRIHRVLVNLLSNAIKFTQKGEVSLDVSVAKMDQDRAVIQFIIKDTGIGIPPDKQEIIFEKFNRLTSSYSGVYAGKGLGLRMVKRFLDEINGEVHVTSEVGKGSVFTVLVPYKLPLLAGEKP